MNALFDTISAGFDNTLSLDGTTPNSLSADIDLNSNDLLNVGSILAQSFKDSAGNSISLANVNTLGAISQDIALLADIQDGTIATNAITNVAANTSSINAVSLLAGDIVTLVNKLSDTGGGLAFDDNAKIKFGAGEDLQIYHNGSNSFIRDVGTGSLFIDGSVNVVIRDSNTGYYMAVFDNQSLGSELYYQGVKKFNTTSSGINVEGAATVSGGVYLGGTGAANHLDDYEEGTFVITNANDATGTLDAGYTSHYTKVGNLVTVTIAFNPATNFSSNFVDGLPFVPNALSIGTPFVFGSGVLGDVANTVVAGLVPLLSRIYFYTNQSIGQSHAPVANNGVYRLTFTYKTA